MNKIIAALALGFITLSAQADPGHYHGNHSYYRGPGYSNNWAAPLITGLVVGGAIGYATAPRYYPQPAPYVAPPPYGFHYQNVFDPTCNCYKLALVPN